jgi:hypothetical protein
LVLAYLSLDSDLVNDSVDSKRNEKSHDVGVGLGLCLDALGISFRNFALSQANQP